MLWPFQVLIKMCSVESDPKTNSKEPQILWYGLCATDTYRLLAGLHVVSLHAKHFIETNPLTAKYFMETNPLTVRIFNLLRYGLRDLWTDFLRHLRITQRTWGHTETEGRALVSSSLTLWYFSSYNKSAGSNTQKRQTDLLVQVEAIVPLTRSPACCNKFFQTLWSGEADFIGLTCLILWITNQLTAAIPTSTRGAHAEKTKPRICSKKSFPAQQVLAIPKRKPQNSS